MKNAMLIPFLTLILASSCTSQASLFVNTKMRQSEDSILGLIGRWKTDASDDVYRFKLNSVGEIIAEIGDQVHISSGFESIGDLDFIIKFESNLNGFNELVGKYTSYKKEKLKLYRLNPDNSTPSVINLSRLSIALGESDE